jgi:hypothetical protein
MKRNVDTMTANEGASLERQAWMAKARRMKKVAYVRPVAFGYLEAVEEFSEFGRSRTKRIAEPGSIGRKAKAAKVVKK